jgi:hypothetical protein
MTFSCSSHRHPSWKISFVNDRKGSFVEVSWKDESEGSDT